MQQETLEIQIHIVLYQSNIQTKSRAFSGTLHFCSFVYFGFKQSGWQCLGTICGIKAVFGFISAQFQDLGETVYDCTPPFPVLTDSKAIALR